MVVQYKTDKEMVRKIIFLIIGIFISGLSMAQPGNALDFDGANDAVVVPNNSALEFTTGTIEVWLKPDWVSGTAGYNPGFIGLRDGSGTRFSFHIRNNYSALDIFNGAVSTVTYAFSQGEWYHIALVLKSTTTDVYINGIYQGTMTKSVNQGNTGQNLNIGSSNGTGEYFIGEIDEVRIWSSQRTACEILSYRNTELVGNETGLIAYYNFNQGTAEGDNTSETSLADLTSNSFNGTLINFALTGTASNWVASGADISNTGGVAVDNIAPTLTVPGDITVQCSYELDPDYSGTATATDICDANPLVTFSDVNNGSSVTRTWKATDAGGNETTGEQVITIDDTTPPPTPVLSTIEGVNSVTVTAPTTRDNCGATITGTTSDPTEYNQQGIYTITWTFEDGSGSTTTADQTVVVDNGQNMKLEFNTKLSAGTTVTLPLNGTVNVTVNWGDGNIESTTNSANLDHTYVIDTTYTVYISGALTQFGRNGTSNAEKLTKVLSFGSLGITNFSYAFRNASNLTDVPATIPPGVTNMASMFRSAGNFNGNIGNWDVSSVTSMSYMFNNAVKFNADISDWNVANVENMDYMFGNTPLFNANIANWNVANDTSMFSMFNGASAFNQNIGKWNVAKVSNMGSMFSEAVAFDQNISNWNVGSVTDMTAMFYNAGLSTINYDSLLNVWSVLTLQPDVTFDAGSSAYSCVSQAARNKIENDFNWTITDAGLLSDDVGISIQPASSTNAWENSGDIVLSIGASGDLELNYQWYKDDVPITPNGTYDTLVIATTLSNSATYQCIVTSVCGTSQASNNAEVTIMDDITAPETPTLPNLTGECSVIATAPTTSDAVAGTVTGTTSDPLEYTEQGTFTITWTFDDGNGNSTSANQTVIVDDYTEPATPILPALAGEDSVIVTIPATNDECAGTIYGTTSDPLKYATQGTYTITWTFDDGNGNSTTADQKIVVNKGQNMVLEFNTNLSAGTTITLPLNGTVDVTVDWGDGNTESTTSSANLSHTYLLNGTYDVIISGSLSHFGRSSYPNADKLTKVLSFGSVGITDLSYAFYYAINLSEVPSTLPTGVTNTSYMFFHAESLNQDLNNWDVSGVTDMNNMFSQAFAFNGNISGWNVGNVTNMERLFRSASVFNQDLNNWDVSNVINMVELFDDAAVFNGNISNWNVSKVQNMYSMFSYAREFNQDIGNWNTSAVTDMSWMFYEASSFNQDLNNWNTSTVTTIEGIFSDTEVFNGDISSWEVGNVTSMTEMFRGALKFNGNIGGWNVSNVTNMSYMFDQAASFDQDISSWDVSNVTIMSAMFNGIALSTTNYDALLIAWSNLTLHNGVTFGAGNNQYSCLGEAARTAIQNNFGWTINDEGLVLDVVTINTQPLSDTVWENTNDIVISVEATGEVALSYQWYKDDVPITSNGDSSSLTITTLPANSGIYYCGVTSACGASEQSANAVVDILDDTTPPVTPTLDTLTGDCSVTAVAPTTTDDAAGTITGTTTDPLEYTDQGTYTITWTFDDGNGNSITVDQNVIVEDVTAPLTPTLAALTGECSVTASAPTTTDVCAGTITGTTFDPLEYTEQGNYIITWTFDDGNGNSINVDQNVIVEDVTAPLTPTLAALTGECSVTASAPTTTDVCAGTITGTTFDPLEYTQQGTYTISWTFDDGNGNSITVDQNVIVEDVTNPTLSCVDNKTVNADASNNYTVQGTEFDPATAEDNCGVSIVENDYNNSSTLTSAQFPVGTTTVTWKITDNAGNTSACSFDVVVSSTTGFETLEQAGIKILPNPTSDFIKLDAAGKQIQKLIISDLSGKQLIKKTSLNMNETFDLSGFGNGIYLISIQTENKVITSKIVKK